MNIKHDYYLRTYAENIRDAFSEPKRNKLLVKLVDAIDFYNNDEYEKALKILLRLRKKCKTVNEDCVVLLFTALCYTDMRYFAPAIDAYREIITIDPTRSTIYSNLGLLYRQMGEYQKAVETFLVALEQDPNNPYAYNNLALTYYRMGEYESAIKHSEKALEIKGNYYQAANCLCLCYFVLGKADAAKKYFRIAVTNGGDPRALKGELAKLREGMMFDYDDDLWWDL